MLTGSRAAKRCPGRVAALAIGCLAALLMMIVGCTTITQGTATVDTAIAPAYRASMSASVSASSATSRILESKRQAQLTTRAVVKACDAFANSSKDAIEKVNAFVGAFNQGHSTSVAEGPAIDALNNSADIVARSISDPLSQELRDALNAYVEASRQVANVIRAHAPTSEFNRQVDQLNDTKSKTVKACLAYS